MPSKYWIKLYHEILDDAKLGTMDDHSWRRCIELFLLAGRNDRDGLLPPVSEIAWALHTSDDDVTKTLRILSQCDIVVTDENGRYFVKNFFERQKSTSGAERTRRYRQKQAKNAGQPPRRDKSGDNGVTKTVTILSPDIQITDINTITTTAGPQKNAAGRLATYYQQQTGRDPPGLTAAQMWEDDCLTVLDYAAGDESRARQLLDEARAILDGLGYTHTEPGSLLKTIEQQLKKRSKKRATGAKRADTNGTATDTATPGAVGAALNAAVARRRKGT